MSAQVLVSIGEKTTGVETVIARLGEPVQPPVEQEEETTETVGTAEEQATPEAAAQSSAVDAKPEDKAQ